LNEADKLDEQSRPNLVDVSNPDVEQFINSMGLYYEAAGGTNISGRILALLLISPGSLTAEQIAGTLKISRASVSTNIRMLQPPGLVERTLVPGDRRDYYRVPRGSMTTLLELRSRVTAGLLKIAELGLKIVPRESQAHENVEEFVDLLRFTRDYVANLMPAWYEFKARKDAQAKEQQ